jgi:hypothetical protein
MGLALFLLTLISNSALAGPSSPPVSLSRAELIEIRQISDQILRECPPANCVLIGVGQSPTPFVAQLEGEQKDYVFPLPLSGFRHNPETDWKLAPPNDRMERYNPQVLEPLTPQQENALYMHLEKYVPDARMLRGRKIKVLDFSLYGGYSAFAVNRYLEKFMTVRGSPTQVGTIVISQHGESPKVKRVAERYAVKDAAVIELQRESPVFERLQSQQYEEYSPYGEHPLKGADLSLKKEYRTRYLQLREELNRRNGPIRLCLENLYDAIAVLPLSL